MTVAATPPDAIAYGSLGGSAIGFAAAQGPTVLGKTIAAGLVQGLSGVIGEVFVDLINASVDAATGNWTGWDENAGAEYADAFIAGFSTGAAASAYGGALSEFFGLDDDHPVLPGAIAGVTTMVTELINADWQKKSVVANLTQVAVSSAVDAVLAAWIARSGFGLEITETKISKMQDFLNSFTQNFVNDGLVTAMGWFYSAAKAQTQEVLES